MAMQSLTSLGLFSRASVWTCRRCLQKQQRSLLGRENFATSARRRPGRRKKNNAVLLSAAAGGSLAAGALFFVEDVKYGYGAMERTGRVMTTLALCINE